MLVGLSKSKGGVGIFFFLKMLQMLTPNNYFLPFFSCNMCTICTGQGPKYATCVPLGLAPAMKPMALYPLLLVMRVNLDCSQLQREALNVPIVREEKVRTKKE